MSEQPRILVIEDERPLARALELKLTSANFDVTTTNTGQAGWDLLETQDFDLLLTDLVMPEMNGFEVIKRIHEKKPDLPIMVLSNLGQESDISKVRTLGVEDYFIKANTPIATIVEQVKKRLKASKTS